MKLLSMTDYVLQQWEQTEINEIERFAKCARYAQFLKQPLKLGMFVPIDKHGGITEPLKGCCSGADCGCMGMPVNVSSREEMDEVLEAENRVLFKDFEIVKSWYEPTNEVVHLPSGMEINVISGSISIPNSNGIGYGIVKNIQDFCDYEFDLTESAITRFDL